MVLVGGFEVAESFEICGFCGGFVGLVGCGSLWEECLSAQEVGESRKFVRRCGNFN